MLATKASGLISGCFQGLALDRYRETRSFPFGCIKVFRMLLHYFQAQVEKECAANLLKLEVTFVGPSGILFLCSVRQVFCQKISSEAIGVKWK